MEVTEYERHQLFVWFEEHMGQERAATMMNLTPPVGWFDLASKHDLVELEGRLDAKFDARLDRLESRMTTKFVTWLLASQGAVVAMVGILLVALR